MNELLPVLAAGIAGVAAFLLLMKKFGGNCIP